MKTRIFFKAKNHGWTPEIACYCAGNNNEKCTFSGVDAAQFLKINKIPFFFFFISFAVRPFSFRSPEYSPLFFKFYGNKQNAVWIFHRIAKLRQVDCNVASPVGHFWTGNNRLIYRNSILHTSLKNDFLKRIKQTRATKIPVTVWYVCNRSKSRLAIFSGGGEIRQDIIHMHILWRKLCHIVLYFLVKTDVITKIPRQFCGLKFNRQ